MTKKELVDALQDWPDYAIVEVSVKHVWYEIVGIEDVDMNSRKDHCLIFTGVETMY